MIEKSVYSEYQTFRRNRENKNINYAHVESVNIFYFIEDILSQQRNNPVQTFDRYAEIEYWLKEQWAGLFRELIQKSSSQKQISSLASQVNELSEMNKTFKKYLEELLSTEPNSDKTRNLISEETHRLDISKRINLLKNNFFFSHLENHGIPAELALEALQKASSIEGFRNELLANIKGLDDEIVENFKDCVVFSKENENDADFIEAMNIAKMPLQEIVDKSLSKPIRKKQNISNRKKIQSRSKFDSDGLKFGN